MPDELSMVPGIEGEPVFAELWQAQTFAMTVALHRKGAFGWDAWATALSDELACEEDYWTAWLRTLETMTTRTGLADAADLAERAAAWRQAANATPHGEPIVLPWKA